MIVKPMAAPTAIAAGRLRPARDFLGFLREVPCTEPSAGLSAGVSVSATDVVC